jgi:TonB family protein
MKKLLILLFLIPSTLCLSQETEEPVIDFPDVEATYIGGSAAMKRYIQAEVNYPTKALQKGEGGTVYITFIVEADGSVSSAKLSRGVSPSLDAEALRVVQEMPKWNPGEYKGKAIRARCRLPITFTIDTSDDDKKKKKSNRK